MKDLTQGSIPRHLLGMAAFIAVNLLFQASYVLIDLYFVSRYGPDAVAGVGAVGTLGMLAMATSQVVGVGGLALISQAAGRRDGADANLVCNQTVSLALAGALGTLGLGYTLGPALVRAIAAEPQTARLGETYLFWFLPALAAIFPMTALGRALRAVGLVRPGMLVGSGTVILNALLAPVLVAGWLTGHPYGVAGAGLASTIANLAGLATLGLLFPRAQAFLRLAPRAWWPDPVVWRRLGVIGLPAMGELMMMFVVGICVYRVLRVFGTEAQAAFGIGSRIMQSIFLPAMAVSFAAAPVAGQNFGARAFPRVRATFRATAMLGAAIMIALTALCQVRPDILVAPFTADPAVAAIATAYLRIMSFNFVGSGLVFACSGMFQGLGDTRPSLLASASRLLTFVAPAFLVVRLPGARLEWIWYLSLVSVALQAAASLVLLNRVFARRLVAA